MFELPPPRYQGPVWPDLILIVFGVVSSVLTAYVLAWLSVNAHASPHRFHLLILRAGAILCSVAAASGYYAASRLLGWCGGYSAGGWILVTSLLTCVAI